MSRTIVVPSPGPVKPLPEALTEGELQRLMHGYMQGNPRITEDDMLALAQWASRVKMEGMLLRMIMQGALVPSVTDGQVCVALPPAVARDNGLDPCP